MKELLSNFVFNKSSSLKVMRPLITNAEAHAASAGLYTTSPSSPPETSGSTRFGLSVSIPGRLLYLFITGFIIINMLSSCTNKNTPPKGILSKDEMAKVLIELYLKEARINNIHVDQDSSKKLMEYYRHQLGKRTGISDSVVEVSYQYYLAHPIALGEIYDRVIDTLALKEQRASVNTGPKSVE